MTAWRKVRSGLYPETESGFSRTLRPCAGVELGASSLNTVRGCSSPLGLVITSDEARVVRLWAFVVLVEVTVRLTVASTKVAERTHCSRR